MQNIRFQALKAIQDRQPAEVAQHPHKNSGIFASHVFTPEVMKEYLPKDVFEQLRVAVGSGETLDRGVADKVASAMKVWAIEKGATHCTHWFQPLTGLTAEKHDAFFHLDGGTATEIFTGDSLAQQEPDASSLPSGGLRNTFEARGYTAWDPSSPAFIFENRFGKTLCIPTIFVSYNGEALDYKAPLLKSMAALEKAATEVCNLFDRNVKKVTATLGVEQEYFLVDKALFELRPDLVLTGRTLIGAAPARGQQLEDHYFGSIPERVFGFMKEFETDCYKLGIPLKTRHNEVAPNQFECAPIFEELNIAVDHNQLLMDILDRVARKHNFRVLLHEKPFAGINGSGKHNNWSMSTDTGKNLLSPGKNPRENMQFLSFFVNTLKAVHDHADLLRAVIASAPNDHRLGANEAPPAIISAFIGTQLSGILDEIEKPAKKKASEANAYLKMGINKIPEILRDNTDRNRTSPFAFTGNKFEFRAVGSSANTSGAMTALNTIVAHQLSEFRKTIDRKTQHGKNRDEAIIETLRDYLKECRKIVFDGNGYSQEWVVEAKRRGLNNIKTTPQALDAYISKKTVELFTEMGIFTEVELHARHEIRLELYTKKVAIESKVMEDLIYHHVIPSCVDYQNRLLKSVTGMKDAGMKKEAWTTQENLLLKISSELTSLSTKLEAMVALRNKIDRIEDPRAKAVGYSDKIMPALAEIRTHADMIETLISDDSWTLPKYREMLFVR